MRNNAAPNVRSSSRFNVNGYMNEYFPNRMEPAGPNREDPLKKLCLENRQLAHAFRILKTKHGFTAEQLQKIAEQVADYSE